MDKTLENRFNQIFNTNYKEIVGIIDDICKDISIDGMQINMSRDISRTAKIMWEFENPFAYEYNITYSFTLCKIGKQFATDNAKWTLSINYKNRYMTIMTVIDMADKIGTASMLSNALNIYAKKLYLSEFPEKENTFAAEKNETATKFHGLNIEKYDISEKQNFAIEKDESGDTLSVLLFPDNLPNDWPEKLDMMGLPMHVEFINKTIFPCYKVTIDTKTDSITKKDIYNIFNETFNW